MIKRTKKNPNFMHLDGFAYTITAGITGNLVFCLLPMVCCVSREKRKDAPNPSTSRMQGVKLPLAVCSFNISKKCKHCGYTTFTCE